MSADQLSLRPSHSCEIDVSGPLCEISSNYARTVSMHETCGPMSSWVFGLSLSHIRADPGCHCSVLCDRERILCLCVQILKRHLIIILYPGQIWAIEPGVDWATTEQDSFCDLCDISSTWCEFHYICRKCCQ